MLHKLFGSNTRVKLLQLYFTDPSREYFVRELTRILEEQINSIRRELDNLKRIGIMRSKNRNRKKYYYLNPNFLLFTELKNIITKTSSNYGDFAIELERFGKLELLLVSGFFLGIKDSPTDLLIIGDLDRAQLEVYIRKLERKLGSELKYALMSKEDYLFRRNCQDKFVKSILESRYVIALDKLNFNFKSDVANL